MEHLPRRHVAAALLGGALSLTTATAAHADDAGGHRRADDYTVYVAGDSTAATKTAAARPETGWGQTLPLFLGHRVTVSNHAVNGASSKSFVDRGWLAPVLEAIRPGDRLLISFGHNDSKSEDPARYTEPFGSYQQYLRQYVDGARRRGAHPVLVTSVERRRFTADGQAYSSHGDYPRAMRELAERERVPLVDLQAESLALWQRLGPEGTKEVFLWLAAGQEPNYPDGVRDNTHFAPHGAIEVARLVARMLQRQRILPARDVRRLGDAIPDSAVTWS
ncbi:rhamnogalacturonan acetylesterase [Allostreptomyces psammosilenae]|uniref:Lysophospholipase L1-like esterase n=1 Tax=Allostreptomyces psammosilenae TaxID=1892865 RepID=A0A852ZXS5_9ACTN|nr:rhamnogalacturonan acetylesterase [Allostreptomyces psammosilenae]NYI06835.1 lysophospholipase L1-like esterase [Allostreptomyces psammosilenae]